eukprot:4614181-Prymnesium_polylepis.2
MDIEALRCASTSGTSCVRELFSTGSTVPLSCVDIRRLLSSEDGRTRDEELLRREKMPEMLGSGTKRLGDLSPLDELMIVGSGSH